jgi:hypothetical protein
MRDLTSDPLSPQSPFWSLATFAGRRQFRPVCVCAPYICAAGVGEATMDETPGYGGWFAADMSIATGPTVVGYARSRAVLRQSTRKEKPVRSSKLQLGLAAAAVIALAVTLGVRRGVIDVLLMVGIAAAVAGMYLLRRYARAGLVYNRHV